MGKPAYGMVWNGEWEARKDYSLNSAWKVSFQ